MAYHVAPGIVASAIKAADTIEKFLEEHEDMDSMFYEETVVALQIIRLQLKHTAWQFVPPNRGGSDEAVMEAVADLFEQAAMVEAGDEETIRQILEDEPLDNATLVVELRELVEPLINWDGDRDRE